MWSCHRRPHPMWREAGCQPASRLPAAELATELTTKLTTKLAPECTFDPHR
jgi:hypothetical protein